MKTAAAAGVTGGGATVKLHSGKNMLQWLLLRAPVHTQNCF